MIVLVHRAALVLVIVLVSACGPSEYRGRGHRGQKGSNPDKPVAAHPKHEHPHLHPHPSGGHHHHPHPHPHLAGEDGHHHPY